MQSIPRIWTLGSFCTLIMAKLVDHGYMLEAWARSAITT